MLSNYIAGSCYERSPISPLEARPLDPARIQRRFCGPAKLSWPQGQRVRLLLTYPLQPSITRSHERQIMTSPSNPDPNMPGSSGKESLSNRQVTIALIALGVLFAMIFLEILSAVFSF